MDLVKGVYEYYQPVGFLETFWSDKVATEMVRLARLMQHEQKVLAWGTPFEFRSPDAILRSLSTTNRLLRQAMQELEKHQTIRKAQVTPPGQPGPAEEPEEPTPAPNGQTDEQATGSVAAATEPQGEQSGLCSSEIAPHRTDAPQATAGDPTVRLGEELQRPAGSGHDR